MSDRSVIPLSAQPRMGKLDEAEYFRRYRESIDDPDGFWGREGKRLDWVKPYTKVMNASFEGDVSIKWYEDGTLNAAANCIDRHLAERGDQVAILKGLDEGQQVVTSGQVKLKNGTPVVIDNSVLPANGPNPTPQEK